MEYRKLHFSVNEGLPSSETYFVHQDREGYMWVCTDRGVARYDGFKFEVFNMSNGLPDNVIFYLVEDYKGRIWFVSNSGKLSYYYRGKIHLYKYNDLIQKNIKLYQRAIKTVSIDALGNVYYSNLMGSILKITSKGKVVHLVDWTSGNDYGEYFFNGDGHLLFSKDWVNEKTQFYLFHGSVKEPVSIHNKGTVLTNTLIIRNHIFIKTLTKLGELKNGKLMEVSYGQNLYNIFNVSDQLWLCTSKGAYQYTEANNFNIQADPEEIYLPENKVSNVFRDRSGGLWFSTLDDGIYYLPDERIKNYKVGAQKSDNQIFDVFAYKNQVYYSNDRGYIKFDDNRLVYKCMDAGINPGIQFGDYLVLRGPYGEGGDKYRFPCKDGDKIISSDYQVSAFGKNNTVLVAHAHLVRIYPDGTFEKIYDNKMTANKDMLIEAIAETNDGVIYAGNVSGLYRFNGNYFIQKSIPEELQKIRISALVYDPKNGLWVGTRGQGIYLLQNNKIVKHITVENGLLDNQINSFFLGSKDELWVTSNLGVSEVVYYSPDLIRIQNLTKMMGLLSSEVSRVCVLNKQIYLATKSGVSVVPEDIGGFISKEKQQVVLKSVRVDKRVRKLSGSELLLSGYDNVIYLYLRTLNYKRSKHQKYRYRLNPEDSWSYSNLSLISLNSLREGVYHVEISYLNEAGVWVKPYELLTIQKTPKYYQATWFYLLLVVLLLAGVTLFFIRRNNQLRAQYAQRTLIEQLEQKSLIAQINPHFIFNSLNSIQSFLIYDENENAEKYLLKLARLIRSTLTVSRENNVTIEMEKSLITQYLELEQMRFKKRFEYRIEMRLTEREQEYFIPPMLIQPFVENSVLHGFVDLKRVGLITVSFLKIEENRLYMEITDNGVGRKPERDQKNSGHRSYGTQITRERLDAFRKKYRDNFHFEIIDLFKDGESAGTKIELIIPVLSQKD